MSSFDEMMESLKRIYQARDKKGACFPDVMPIDFLRIKELFLLMEKMKDITMLLSDLIKK